MNEPDDLESLYTVLAFDPGGTTGWAVISIWDGVIGPTPFRPEVFDAWTVDDAYVAYKAEVAEAKQYRILDNVAFWASGQYTGDRGDQVDQMELLTLAWPSTCPLVVEGFILRQFRMDSMLLEPVRVTERYRHAIRDTGPSGTDWRSKQGTRRDVIQQPASLAKTTITDDRLRQAKNGFHSGTAGKEHARDAVRHALTFLRREKEARSYGRTLHVC